MRKNLIGKVYDEKLKTTNNLRIAYLYSHPKVGDENHSGKSSLFFREHLNKTLIRFY